MKDSTTVLESNASYMESSGILTIDLDALQSNYNILRTYSLPAQTAAVVKADAYGIGARIAAPALYEMGCRLFFVAYLVEAFHLKPFLPIDAKIAILNGIPEKKKKQLPELDLFQYLILFHLFVHGFLFVVKEEKNCP